MSLPALSVRVRLGPLAQRHRDDLGRVAVAALLALAPDIVIITPEDLRHDLIAIAMETIERQRMGR